MAKRKPTHLTFLRAGLEVDTSRPMMMAPWTDDVAVAVYEDDISKDGVLTALVFAGGDYLVPQRFFAVTDTNWLQIAFEGAFEQRRLTFRQLVIRLKADDAPGIDLGHKEAWKLLNELLEQTTGLVAISARQTRAGLAFRFAPSDKAGVGGWFEAYQAEVKPVAPRRGKELTAEHFEKVAEVYRAALFAGRRNPTQAVADSFKRPYSTAARWVWRARHDFHTLADAPAPGQSGEKGD
jgi:hypothetical protein